MDLVSLAAVRSHCAAAVPPANQEHSQPKQLQPTKHLQPK
jgi:hypothetical protein